LIWETCGSDLQIRIPFHQGGPIASQAERPPVRVRDKAAPAAAGAVGLEEVNYFGSMRFHRFPQCPHRVRLVGAVVLDLDVHPVQREPIAQVGQLPHGFDAGVIIHS
jgi:hypothetical protein